MDITFYMFVYMSAKKDCHITIRVSAEELEEIREYASRVSMSQSEFALASIRSGMGKTGLEEKYLILANRLEALEQAFHQFQQAA